jgi:hypothetical protein
VAVAVPAALSDKGSAATKVHFSTVSSSQSPGSVTPVTVSTPEPSATALVGRAMSKAPSRNTCSAAVGA